MDLNLSPCQGIHIFTLCLHLPSSSSSCWDCWIISSISLLYLKLNSELCILRCPVRPSDSLPLLTAVKILGSYRAIFSHLLPRTLCFSRRKVFQCFPLWVLPRSNTVPPGSQWLTESVNEISPFPCLMVTSSVPALITSHLDYYSNPLTLIFLGSSLSCCCH